jgi:hypothetical protein
MAFQQDQLLTKEGALKMAGIRNATFLKAINDGIVKPQLVKGRKKAMYLESEVLKVEKKKPIYHLVIVESCLLLLQGQKCSFS